METAVEIATAVVSWIAPFTPYLIKGMATTGKKFAETIAEKGGEAAWEKAKKIWQKMDARFGQDTELKGASMLVAAKPENEKYQHTLSELLSERLVKDTAFARELLKELSASTYTQEMTARDHSMISDPAQIITNTSTGRIAESVRQEIQATKGSIITGAKQKFSQK